MVTSYLVSSWRNFRKTRIYGIINFLGLTISLASFGFVALWIHNELSYDRYHPDADRLYRITPELQSASETVRYAVSPAVMASMALNEITEIESASRFNSSNAVIGNSEQNKFFEEEEFCFTDPATFKIFGYKFLFGNSATALVEPNSLVLTEEMAIKYFGKREVIGNTLMIRTTSLGRQQQRVYTITGIIQNIPQTTSFRHKFFASFSTFEQWGELQARDWGMWWFFSYVKLAPNSSAADVEKKMNELLQRHASKEDREGIRYYLQPITDIHLFSDLRHDLDNGDFNNVIIFFMVAMFIIFIACINFVNLSTARSMDRFQEVAIRKIFGAQRKQLMFKFLTETILTVAVSALSALAAIEILLPEFNQLAETQIAINWSSWEMILSIFGIIFFVGLTAGLYPSFLLSGFKPTKMLQSRALIGNQRSAWLRKSLIVIQFSVSLILLIGTGVITHTLDYFKNRKLGYDKDHIVFSSIPQESATFRYDSFKKEMIDIPNVQAVSRSFVVAGSGSEGIGVWNDGQSVTDAIQMTQYSVDEDFNLLYNIQLVSGRNFSPQFQTDSSACILNEKAVGALGLSAGDAIGKTLFIGRSKCTIVGVVKDFYYSSHRRPIRPLVMRMVAHRFNFVSIKFNGGDLKNNVEKVESVYRSFLPDQPVNFRFVDDEVQNRFREENRLEKIFSYFSTIAIVVASFGLFGLAAYSTSQRSREVAIRKILGASPSGIAFKLVFEFVVLVLLAGAIGIPMAYTFIQEWLTQFPDTIYIGWGLFAQSMLICIFVAILSVSYKSILIALSNPAKVLRSE